MGNYSNYTEKMKNRNNKIYDEAERFCRELIDLEEEKPVKILFMKIL